MASRSARGGARSFQAADVVRDVDRVLAQRLDRHDLQRALVRGGQDDARGRARLVRLQPADGDDAPPVAGLQAGEAVLRAAAWTGRCPGRAASSGSRPRRRRRRCASRGPRDRCCSARPGRSRSPGRGRRAAAGRPARCARPEDSGCTGAPALVRRRAVVDVGTGWHGAGVTTSSPEELWRPTPESIRATRIAQFAAWVAERRGLDFGDPTDYDALWRWSVEHLDQFWADVATWTDVLPGVPDDEVLTPREMPGAVWFPGRTINFAEQALRYASDERPGAGRGRRGRRAGRGLLGDAARPGRGVRRDAAPARRAGAATGWPATCPTCPRR